jgi:serine/threonine-protein kinase
MDPAPVLLAHVGLGNKEEAFSLLEEAYTARSTALTSLGVNPIYDPLREDPRFQLLMRRIGLAP